MESNNSEKKKGSPMSSRKKIIIGLVVLSLAAIIAEAVLLIHGLSKKPEKKEPAQVTPAPVLKKEVPKETTPKVSPTPTRTPSPTPEVDHYEQVWKLAKEYKTDSNGIKEPVSVREYDDQGRESKRIVYDDAGEPELTAVFVYDRSGIVLVEQWVPTEDGELEETRFIHGAGGNTDMAEWGYYIDIYGGEKVVNAEYDADGNLTALRTSYHPYWASSLSGEYSSDWTIDSNGLLKERRLYEPSGKQNSAIQFRYDDEGRLTGFIFLDDLAESISHWGLTYEDGYTYYTDELNGTYTFKFKDDNMLMYARFMGYDEDWPGALNVTDENQVFPDMYRGIVYRPRGNFPAFFDTNYTIEGYAPDSFSCIDEVYYDEHGNEVPQDTVEVRSDGQPAYGDGFEQKYYEYDASGKLTRYYDTTNPYDVYTELDDNWNLVKMTDVLNKEIFEYEWILVDVPVYK